MSEVDVAREVEKAGLDEMSAMDIDNVYTLMDVQLRERPTPRELYKRWEKQNWSVYDLDFSKDVSDWAILPERIKDEIIGGLHAFFLGEAAVTDTLSPIVHAAPTELDRQFLSTQLVDEARHTIFFERFFKEVLGIDGLEAARSRADFQPYLARDTRGYGRLFYVHLVETTDAVRQDPGDYGKWVDAVVLYHMVIEGMLALYGQRQLLKAAKAFGILPGFRAGFTAVTRDESRHVNYAVYALRQASEKGLGERIVEICSRFIEDACAVLTRVHEKIEIPEPEILAMLPEEIRQDRFSEVWAFPMTQLRKRLRPAGIGAEAIDQLDRQWWEHIEANLNEYEDRFGESHPARMEEGWQDRRAAPAPA